MTESMDRGGGGKVLRGLLTALASGPPTAGETPPSSRKNAEMATSVPPGPAGRETILVADDELFILRLAQSVLNPEGYRILLAENGQKALDAYRQAAGAVGLVVLDQTMPKLSGLQTLDALRALDPHVRVLLTSGYLEKDLPEGVREKVCGFLGKPFSPDQFLDAIRAALAGPR